MTVHSWALSLVRLFAKFYVWFVALALVVPAVKLFGVLWSGLFGHPTSFVFDLGREHPPLAADAYMIEDSPLVVGHSAPFLGGVAAELQTVLTVAYPTLIVVLALRTLDLARTDGPFCEAMPRRLSWLGWALVAQPVSALAQALCSAQLNSHVLAGITFGDALSTAFTNAFAWPAIGAGAGMLLLRSIIVEGVGMRRDLDGTV